MVHPYLRRRRARSRSNSLRPPRRMAPRRTAQSCWRRRWACPVPGTGDEARHRCREVHSRRGQWLRRRWRRSAMSARSISYERQDGRRHGRARLRPDFAERCFNQMKGFGEYGFPGKPCASAFAPSGLCVVLAEVPYPAAVICLRAAEFAADGLLRARPDRARCAGAWGGGASGGCER
jgi:error-prone DNA polymerase